MDGRPAGRPASGSPATNPVEQLRRVARLHWLLFGCGVGLLLLGVALGQRLLGAVSLLLVGFALGLLLAAFLVSGLLVVCPFCRRSLRGVVRDRCRMCGARFAGAPDGPAG